MNVSEIVKYISINGMFEYTNGTSYIVRDGIN
jgi:hypothetical protein